MTQQVPSALERAFALADVGLPVSQIRVALSREGFDVHQLGSKTVSKQLSDRARAVRNEVQTQMRAK